MDSGIGLDPAEVPRLFERFFRGTHARQRAPEGSGLGLAIARTIVERHHGSIDVAGVDPRGGQGGCCVEVLLPLDCDAQSAPQHQARVAVAANIL